MTNEPAPDLPRFLVSRLQAGPWLVIDRLHNGRLVASCPLEDDARAIAALMHRDPVDALRYVKFTLERLDVLLIQPAAAARSAAALSKVFSARQRVKGEP